MIIKSLKSGYQLQIDSVEKQVLLNIINYITVDLSDELSIRTGFTPIEYKDLLSQLDKANSSNSYIPINKNHIIMLHQALNEVCNGIEIIDFEYKIGMALSDVNKLFLPLSVLLN